MLTSVCLLDDLILGFCYSNLRWKTGGLKLVLTITLVLQGTSYPRVLVTPNAFLWPVILVAASLELADIFALTFLFNFFFLVTLCLIVVVQSCMEWISILKKVNSPGAFSKPKCKIEKLYHEKFVIFFEFFFPLFFGMDADLVYLRCFDF